MSSSTSTTTTTQQPYAREQQIAIAAVLKASLLAQKIQQELVGSGGVQKKDKSPVTGQFPAFGARSLLILVVRAMRDRQLSKLSLYWPGRLEAREGGVERGWVRQNEGGPRRRVL